MFLRIAAMYVIISRDFSRRWGEFEAYKTEISNNKVAVEAVRKLLNGPDANYTRLWWDTKPLIYFQRQ